MSLAAKTILESALIAFGTTPELLFEHKDSNLVQDRDFDGLDGSGGGTNLADALKMAGEVLQRNEGSPEDFRPYVFVLSDGGVNQGTEAQTRQEAQKLTSMQLSAGVPTVVTIAIGDTVIVDFLKEIAHG